MTVCDRQGKLAGERSEPCSTLSFYPHQKKHLQKASAFSVMIALRQVMSDEMLRIVMIGFAKFKKQRQSYLNICASKSITREALITLNLPSSKARHGSFVLLAYIKLDFFQTSWYNYNKNYCIGEAL
jgi:hypothetical protein